MKIVQMSLNTLTSFALTWTLSFGQLVSMRVLIKHQLPAGKKGAKKTKIQRCVDHDIIGFNY